MSAVLVAVLCAALGVLVPRLIAAVPEPDEPAEDKQPYADIAARPGLAWQSALICAVIGALIGGAVGLDLALLFLVPLVPVGVALALIDWRTRLLPTRIIAPTYLVLVPLVVIAALASGEPRLLLLAAIGWAVMGGLYLLLWLIHPAGMGYGDVRLSGILGIVLGYLGWQELALGSWSGFLLGGIGGALLAAFKVVDRRHNPFGPWMLIGALAGIVVGPAFAVWMWGDLAA
ncbi:prepilin peptidase [Nocardioides allogilvus]|uniref:prepilin peptidase n=1 Tax=Nocardioides allogilvus TaxID=2072017 RepID=UPI000D325BCD|nr:A24 family peptidase [Nocardioides allogilvus]